MVTEELIKYISQEKDNGKTQESITTQLLAQGWSSQDIQAAFTQLRTLQTSQNTQTQIIPSNLKKILIVWFILIIIETIGVLIYITIEIYALFQNLNINLGVIFVLLPSILVALLIFELYRACRGVWQGNNKSVRTLKIYAALTMLSIPIGTLLGFFTFKILRDPLVKKYLSK